MFSYSQAKTIITVAFVFASCTAIALEDVFEDLEYAVVPVSSEAKEHSESNSISAEDKGENAEPSSIVEQDMAEADTLPLTTELSVLNEESVVTEDVLALTKDIDASLNTNDGEIAQSEALTEIDQTVDSDTASESNEVEQNEALAEVAQTVESKIASESNEVEQSEALTEVAQAIESEMASGNNEIEKSEALIVDAAIVEEPVQTISDHAEQSESLAEDTQVANLTIENETNESQLNEQPLVTAEAEPSEVVAEKPVIETTVQVTPPVMSDPIPTSSETTEASESLQYTNMDTQSCPSDFYQVQLPKDGKLCQVFAADLPASMIFFVPKSPQEVLSFYQTNDTSFSAIKEVKGRILMQNQDKTKTVILSEDGQGTQVDVLVKS